MAIRIYHFEVYCEVEEATLKTWAESAPSVCPHNPAHDLDLSKTKILNSIEDGAIEAKIQEEDPTKRTGGHYQMRSFEIDVDATSGWKSVTISFPHDISILAAEWINRASYLDDEADFCIAPDSAIGDITADVAAAATVIPLPAAAIAKLRKGYYLKLDDGTNVDDLGRIIAIDTVGNTATVETATTNAFAAATPSTAKMTVKIVPYARLSGSGNGRAGDEKIGGTFIKANTPMELRYNNISGTAKKFVVDLKYLY